MDLYTDIIHALTPQSMSPFTPSQTPEAKEEESPMTSNEPVFSRPVPVGRKGTRRPGRR